jgi:5-methylcytosine-specific restriction protein A
MPTINKPPKKKREYNVEIQNENREFTRKLYGSVGWQKLRLRKLQDNPLCEQCELDGRITLASEVHHVNKFMKERNEENRIYMFYLYDNLMSVCPSCHVQLDNPGRKKKFDF